MPGIDWSQVCNQSIPSPRANVFQKYTQALQGWEHLVGTNTCYPSCVCMPEGRQAEEGEGGFYLLSQIVQPLLQIVD
jgi:hypothetical protein